MASNNGGSGPWGNPPGSSGGDGERKPTPGPWGNGGGRKPDDKGETTRGARPSGDGQKPGGPFGGGPFGGGSSGGGPKPGGPLGGGRFGGGPFGGGPRGGGASPDIDRWIASAQAFVSRILGGGGFRGGTPGTPVGRFGGNRLIALGALIVLGFWMFTGFYRVQPDEQGVVMRFGAYSYWTEPGLHWHLPWPIESVDLPAVTRINRTEIGYRSADPNSGEPARAVPGESLMLTGDENIIDISFAVFWRIAPNQAPAFLFNTLNPEGLVRAVAESSMREVMGRTPIQPALTQLRAQIEADVMKQTQAILDHYKAGVEITQVQLQRVDPPDEVIESFRDVQRANTDAQRMRNEAEAYRNSIVPRARGAAAQIIAEAEGEKAATIAQATGQSQRFDKVLRAYEAAKDVTLRRMYLDTMQDILSHSQPLVVDDKLKGLVPFLRLNVPAAPPAAMTKPGPGTSAQETPATMTPSAVSSGASQ